YHGFCRNQDETDVIMTKIRLVSSGGCSEVVVEGFGGDGVGQGAAGRPTGGSGVLSVVDAAGGVGEGLAGAAPAELDELGRDGHRGLLGGSCPQVKPDRGAQPRQFVLGQPGLAQPRQPVVVGPAAAHGPDV